MLAIAVSLACEAQPRQRPLDVGPVASGPGTVEFERRRLQGTWRPRAIRGHRQRRKAGAVRAEAILTYDEYGNLIVRGKLLEPMPGEKTIEIACARLSGPIVLDPQRASSFVWVRRMIHGRNRSGARKQDRPGVCPQVRADRHDAANFLSESERQPDSRSRASRDAEAVEAMQAAQIVLTISEGTGT